MSIRDGGRKRISRRIHFACGALYFGNATTEEIHRFGLREVIRNGKEEQRPFQGVYFARRTA